MFFIKYFFSKIRYLELASLRFFTMGLTFVTMPILLNTIGVDSYGIYSIILSIFAIGTLFDLGVSNSLISPAAIAYSKNDMSLLKELVSKSIFTLLLATSLFSILAIILTRVIDLGTLFNVQISLRNEFSKAILIAFLLIGPNTFQTITSKIAVALGKANESARWLTASALLTSIVSIFFAVHFKSLYYIVVAQTCIPAIMGFLNFFVLSRSFPHIIPNIRIMNSISIVETIKSSRLFFFLQIASMLSYQLDLLLTGLFLAPDAVAELSLTWKIASIPFLLISASAIPIWQKSAIAFEQNGSVQDLIWKIAKPLLPLTAGWSLLFYLFGGKAIEIWSNYEIYPGKSLILACSVWSFLASLMAAFSVVLNGIRSSKFLLFTTGLFAISNLLFSIIVIQITKSNSGPIIGSCISSLFCFFIPFFLYSQKVLNRYPKKRLLN